MSADLSFGRPTKDQTYDNLNVNKTLGQCNTSIRAKCILAETVTAREFILADTPQDLPASVQVFRTNTIVDSNGGTLVFDTVISDPSAMYNLGTGEFTVPQDGLYAISGSACMGNFNPPTTATVVGLIVAINSSNNLKKKFLEIPAAQNVTVYGVDVYWEISLDAGDTILFAFDIGGLGDVTTGDLFGADLLAPPPGSQITSASVRLLI